MKIEKKAIKKDKIEIREKSKMRKERGARERKKSKIDNWLMSDKRDDGGNSE